MNKDKLKSIYSEIRKFKTIYIVRHIGPDPDAVASEVALRDTIKLTFPSKEVYSIGASVARFKYIGKLDKVSSFDYENSLVITLDLPNISRVDGLNLEKFKNVIKIDHHPFVEKIGYLEYIDEKATSTCEILLDLVNNTKLKMNEHIAKTLMIGIISDSNRFLFYPSDEKILYKVADLVKKYKLNLQEIYDEIYKKPMSELRLISG